MNYSMMMALHFNYLNYVFTRMKFSTLIDVYLVIGCSFTVHYSP